MPSRSRRGTTLLILAAGLASAALVADGQDAGPAALSSPQDPVTRGQELFQANGCDSCHSTDGQRKLGPTLRGFWGTRRSLADGSAVVADEGYFNESVLDPQARLVRGYGPSMPSYNDVVTTEELSVLAAYVRSLRRSDTSRESAE